MSRTNSIIPLEGVPDWEQRLARQDAFWDCAVLDRPVVLMTCPKSPPECDWPADKPYASHRERWMDTDRVVATAVANARNTEYLGDALPRAWPNLGPEVFSAFFGMEMEYTAETSWGIPIVEDWDDVDHVRFSEDNFYWKKLVEMTDACSKQGGACTTPASATFTRAATPWRPSASPSTSIPTCSRVPKRFDACLTMSGRRTPTSTTSSTTD